MDKPRRPRADAAEEGSASGRAPGDHLPNDRLVEGRVMELLPSQLMRVELDGRHQVTAHLADPVRRNFVRVLVGDRVRVVLMAHDPTRARVVEKL